MYTDNSWTKTNGILDAKGITMDLKDFVAISLEQIIDGVKIAQENSKEAGALINPHSLFIFTDNRGEDTEHIFSLSERTVEFDVAVTAIEEDKAKGGFGLVVAGLIGAGVQGGFNTTNSIENRIRFSVPVYLPRQLDERIDKQPKPGWRNELSDVPGL